MSYHADDRHVVVTGAATGIGQATAMRLAARGACLTLFDVDEAPLRATAECVAEFGRVAGLVVGDATVEDCVRRLFDEASAGRGGIRGVVHAAGIMRGQHRDIRELDETTWMRVLAVNLTGTFLVAKHAARVMADSGGGVLVIVGSRAGVSSPSGSIPYGASKGGVHGLVMALERQLAKHSIRVHEICPGEIDTPLMRASIDEGVANGADAAAVEALRRRLATPEGVADVACYLLSGEAAYVTGTIFTR